MRETEIYIYETIDGEVGACVEEPPENCAILTTRNLTKGQIRNILYNGNMSIPLQTISEIKSKYL